MAEGEGKRWQFWLMIFFALLGGFAFAILFYNTPNKQAAFTYSLFTYGLAGMMVALYGILVVWKKRSLPFNYTESVPPWRYGLSVLMIPAIYFLAQAVQFVLGGDYSLTAVIPELIDKIPQVRFAVVDDPAFAFAATGLSAVIQVVGWNFGEVAPAEEFVKIGLLNLGLLGLAYDPDAKHKQYWKVIVLILILNLVWTGLHGVLLYTTASQFSTAFMAGILFAFMAWWNENPFPGILGHGLWNVYATLGYLDPTIMLMTAVVGIILVALLWMWKHK